MRPEPEVEDLIADLGGNLRAVLRDVLCGHLDPQLRRVADEMLEAELREPHARDKDAEQSSTLNRCRRASEREALDVVDVAVELGDDDRRRVAELRGRSQALDLRGLARGERRSSCAAVADTRRGEVLRRARRRAAASSRRPGGARAGG